MIGFTFDRSCHKTEISALLSGFFSGNENEKKKQEVIFLMNYLAESKKD